MAYKTGADYAEELLMMQHRVQVIRAKTANYNSERYSVLSQIIHDLRVAATNLERRGVTGHFKEAPEKRQPTIQDYADKREAEER